MVKKSLCLSILALFIASQAEAAEIWSEPSKTEVWSQPTKTEIWTENWNTKTNTQPVDTKKSQEKQKQNLNVNDFIGKWKLWIPGGMTSYYYVNSGNYAGSKYNPGASNGTLTINKDGTYTFNKTKGKWRAAKPGEVYGAESAIILTNGPDKVDWAVKKAVKKAESKDGKIVLLWDSGGKYTDGSKIWIAGSEGTKTK
ncbi:hypothetical protein [Aneurinibacillus danicus]|uniref:Uncharacterized protein n=1 Tax=Aneurinibacillus danicus TaxID=267746 RepID=A0A511V985_9BACL|nr:hypothetical protein [Aneurinibacillus danicus]GEN35450.1 hypothetical protein ADA01nite_29100 [Aneurinibacillus danicus]